MGIAFIVNTSVIATFAVFVSKNPESGNLTLYSAADALSTSFGPTARIIWAIGLLAAG